MRGHHQCSGALGKRKIVASFYSSKEAPVLSSSHMNKGTSKQLRSTIRSHGNADCLLKICQICLSNKKSGIWMMSENVLVRVRAFFLTMQGNTKTKYLKKIEKIIG